MEIRLIKMAKKDYRAQFYAKYPIENVKAIDNCISRLGYKSRTEIITAFISCLLEWETEIEQDLVFTIAKDLRGNQTNKQHLSETQIKRNLRKIIGKMLMPVIAHKGFETAFSAGCDDVRSEFFEKYGLLLTDDEIHNGFYQYELLNKSILRQYQLERLHTKEE